MTRLYPSDRSGCLITVFDVSDPGAAQRLRHERAAWREYGAIETLDASHYALIVLPGAARELTE